MIMDEFKVNFMSICLNAVQDTGTEIDLSLEAILDVSTSWTRDLLTCSRLFP
jgi:hypothetical protein